MKQSNQLRSFVGCGSVRNVASREPRVEKRGSPVEPPVKGSETCDKLD